MRYKAFGEPRYTWTALQTTTPSDSHFGDNFHDRLHTIRTHHLCHRYQISEVIKTSEISRLTYALLSQCTHFPATGKISSMSLQKAYQSLWRDNIENLQTTMRYYSYFKSLKTTTASLMTHLPQLVF